MWRGSRWTNVKFMVKFEVTRTLPDGDSISQTYIGAVILDDKKDVGKIIREDLPEAIHRKYLNAASECDAFYAGDMAFLKAKVADAAKNAIITSEYATLVSLDMPDGLSVMTVNVRRIN